MTSNDPTGAIRAALRQLVGPAILLHGDGSTHTLVALTDAQCDALLALLAGLHASFLARLRLVVDSYDRVIGSNRLSPAMREMARIRRETAQAIVESCEALPNMAMLMIRTGKLDEALKTLEDLDKQMFDLAHPEEAE